MLAHVYERCREAFVSAECAFAQLQQAMSRGRFDGPELEEFLTRIGHHRQWADLALRMADAEVERFAQDRQRSYRSSGSTPNPSSEGGGVAHPWQVTPGHPMI